MTITGSVLRAFMRKTALTMTRRRRPCAEFHMCGISHEQGECCVSKLRIASYYENRLGRNDGNPLYMWRAFKDLSVESGHLIPYGDLSKFGTWDLNVECDWGQDALKGVLPYEPVAIPKPSVFWHSDSHLGYEWRL